MDSSRSPRKQSSRHSRELVPYSIHSERNEGNAFHLRFPRNSPARRNIRWATYLISSAGAAWILYRLSNSLEWNAFFTGIPKATQERIEQILQNQHVQRILVQETVPKLVGFTAGALITMFQKLDRLPTVDDVLDILDRSETT